MGENIINKPLLQQCSMFSYTHPDTLLEVRLNFVSYKIPNSNTIHYLQMLTCKIIDVKCVSATLQDLLNKCNNTFITMSILQGALNSQDLPVVPPSSSKTMVILFHTVSGTSHTKPTITVHHIYILDNILN